jgi:hypothetical protein
MKMEETKMKENLNKTSSMEKELNLAMYDRDCEFICYIADALAKRICTNLRYEENYEGVAPKENLAYEFWKTKNGTYMVEFSIPSSESSSEEIVRIHIRGANAEFAVAEWDSHMRTQEEVSKAARDIAAALLRSVIDIYDSYRADISVML